jgi:hypothetical protein
MGWPEITLKTSGLVHADYVNLLGGSVQTIKKNTGTLVLASKEIGIEVNAIKTKYLVMCRDQNAGQVHNIKIDKKIPLKTWKSLILGITFTNQNSFSLRCSITLHKILPNKTRESSSRKKLLIY